MSRWILTSLGPPWKCHKALRRIELQNAKHHHQLKKSTTTTRTLRRTSGQSPMKTGKIAPGLQLRKLPYLHPAHLVGAQPHKGDLSTTRRTRVESRQSTEIPILRAPRLKIQRQAISECAKKSKTATTTSLATLGPSTRPASGNRSPSHHRANDAASNEIPTTLPPTNSSRGWMNQPSRSPDPTSQLLPVLLLSPAEQDTMTRATPGAGSYRACASAGRQKRTMLLSSIYAITLARGHRSRRWILLGPRMRGVRS